MLKLNDIAFRITSIRNFELTYAAHRRPADAPQALAAVVQKALQRTFNVVHLEGDVPEPDSIGYRHLALHHVLVGEDL
jgi:hypothetical protein